MLITATAAAICDDEVQRKRESEGRHLPSIHPVSQLLSSVLVTRGNNSSSSSSSISNDEVHPSSSLLLSCPSNYHTSPPLPPPTLMTLKKAGERERPATATVAASSADDNKLTWLVRRTSAFILHQQMAVLMPKRQKNVFSAFSLNCTAAAAAEKSCTVYSCRWKEREKR